MQVASNIFEGIAQTICPANIGETESIMCMVQEQLGCGLQVAGSRDSWHSDGQSMPGLPDDLHAEGTNVCRMNAKRQTTTGGPPIGTVIVGFNISCFPMLPSA